jgi:hypothetical protein
LPGGGAGCIKGNESGWVIAYNGGIARQRARPGSGEIDITQARDGTARLANTRNIYLSFVLRIQFLPNKHPAVFFINGGMSPSHAKWPD